jgi:hypothetical protein
MAQAAHAAMRELAEKRVRERVGPTTGDIEKARACAGGLAGLAHRAGAETPQVLLGANSGRSYGLVENNGAWMVFIGKQVSVTTGDGTRSRRAGPRTRPPTAGPSTACTCSGRPMFVGDARFIDL